MPVTAKKVLEGGDAKDIIVNKSISKSNLTKAELEFILSKLRDSHYKGFEFERFYVIWVKLNSMMEKIK